MDREAFIDAIRNDPADNTTRLVFADWLDDYGETDWDAATAEFCRLCFKRLKFETVGVITDDDAKAVRRKVPGWREWLCSDREKWWRLDGKPHGVADRYPPGALFPKVFEPKVMNWNRLLPSLWSALENKGAYARRGATVMLRTLLSVDLTFNRGFLARSEFRNTQAAAKWLREILIDQPLAQPGLMGQPYRDRLLKSRWFVAHDRELMPFLPRAEDLPKSVPSGRERGRLAVAIALKRFVGIPLLSEPTPCKST